MTILSYNPFLTRMAEAAKGQWNGAMSDGKRTALVSCPGCGRIASLSKHAIGEDGTVSPSLVCPYDDCDFHDYVRLHNWQYGPAPEVE